MTRSLPRDRGSVDLALATYACVLRLYPAVFRQRFGHEMTQVFRDGCRAAWYTHGGWGVLRLWLATLPDVLVTAAKEHLYLWNKGEVHMSTTVWGRIGGIMAFVAVASGLFAQGFALVTSLDYNNLWGRRAELGAEVAFLLVLLALAFVQRSRLGFGAWLVGLVGLLVLIPLLHTILYAHQFVPVPGLVQNNQGWGPISIADIVVCAGIYLAAFAGAGMTWRERTLERWSSFPFWMVLWSFLVNFIAGFASLWLNGAFHGQNPSVPYFHGLVLKDTLLLVPGWIFLVGTGIGLLQLASQSAPTPAPTSAIAEATQGK